MNNLNTTKLFFIFIIFVLLKSPLIANDGVIPVVVPAAAQQSPVFYWNEEDDPKFKDENETNDEIEADDFTEDKDYTFCIPSLKNVISQEMNHFPLLRSHGPCSHFVSLSARNSIERSQFVPVGQKRQKRNFENTNSNTRSHPYGYIPTNITGHHIMKFQEFKDIQNCIVLSANILKNNGKLISDYSPQYHHRAHIAIQAYAKRQNLNLKEFRENSDYLNIPSDYVDLCITEGYAILSRHAAILPFPIPSHSEFAQLILRNTNQPGRATANIDHLFPRSQGGTNDYDNAIVCSGSFNTKKSDRIMDELLNYYLNENYNNPIGEKVKKVLFPSDEIDESVHRHKKKRNETKETTGTTSFR